MSNTCEKVRGVKERKTIAVDVGKSLLRESRSLLLFVPRRRRPAPTPREFVYSESSTCERLAREDLECEGRGQRRGEKGAGA